MDPKLPDHPNSSWVIVTLKRPVAWARSDHESWAMVPPIRYVINAEHLPNFGDHVESVSDMVPSGFYTPWKFGQSLERKRFLIERHRNRGIGDILFLTGPMSWLFHMSGGSVQIYFKSLIDRGSILTGHPALHLQMPFYGPTPYDSLPLYSYQWFVSTVTEYDEEPDQLNVYDSLFQQLGVDHTKIGSEFKRPSIHLDASDERALHAFFRMVYNTNKLDLRLQPYAVLSPFTHGFVRAAPYQLFLDTLAELSKVMPVVVIGVITARTPITDMPPGQMWSQVEQMAQGNPNIINLIGSAPLRTILALISHAQFLIGLDSAPIYMAQACHVPAISLWGPHNPRVRIGYDEAMMKLAIWPASACVYAGCSAWRQFPASKCPKGSDQKVCQVIQAIPLGSVMTKVEQVMSQG